MARKNWYPLDNAAKIYPPNTDEKSPFIFSFSARLNEEVDHELLEKALNCVLTRFPSFKTRLKRGFFWYYLEENKNKAIVKEQPAHYLRHISPTSNNGYMFEVFYRENIVTINIHHSLTDGTGGINFFIELLFDYFKLMGYPLESEGIIRPSAAPYVLAESEDTFKTLDKKKGNFSPFEKLPFKFVGTPYNYDGCGIISGECSVDKLKECAKKYGASITEYLAAVYMYSFYEAFFKDRPLKNKLIKILVPVNLRKHFSTKTVRNFALFVRLTHDFNNLISFEECVNLCKQQMKDGLELDKIERMIHYNVKTEKNPFLKIVPLFIKDIAMKLTYLKVGENLQSGDLSNIGLIKTPDCFKDYLKDITFLIGPNARAGQNFGVIGYNGKIYITSARNYVESALERKFFRKLSSDGVDVTVTSNYWEVEL